MAKDRPWLSEQHESAPPSVTTQSQTRTKPLPLGSTPSLKNDGSEKEPPAPPLEKGATPALIGETSNDVDGSPSSNPNETCLGCGKLNGVCSCDTDVLVDYSQGSEKPASGDKPIVDVGTKTTDTTPLPQEAETPPHEATHNLMVKLLTQKVAEALTTNPLTSDQSDLTRTVNAAYEIITAANRADDQVGES